MASFCAHSTPCPPHPSPHQAQKGSCKSPIFSHLPQSKTTPPEPLSPQQHATVPPGGRAHRNAGWPISACRWQMWERPKALLLATSRETATLGSVLHARIALRITYMRRGSLATNFFSITCNQRPSEGDNQGAWNQTLNKNVRGGGVSSSAGCWLLLRYFTRTFGSTDMPGRSR